MAFSNIAILESLFVSFYSQSIWYEPFSVVFNRKIAIVDPDFHLKMKRLNILFYSIALLLFNVG